MTSWPWMKGVATAIADPIDPVDPHDVRESVKALIVQHRAKLDKIAAALGDDPLYDASRHDDLWILRFWLSHGKSRAAIAAAKHALKFRHDHGLDKHDVRAVVPHNMHQDKRVKEYWDERAPGDSLILTHPDPQRGILCFINLAQMVPGASNVLSQDTWDWAFIMTSEWTHQWLDYVTRTTGRLTRSIRFIDLQGISMKAFHRKDMKYDGDIMGRMEDCYPQLLESIKVCHAPTFIHILWSLGRAILPSRVVNKFDIIEPHKNEKERQSLYRHISHDKLPVKFGGGNAVPPRDW